MSRIRKFAHALLSGYVLLGANTLYTLAAVPLALSYLSIPEFGLWGVTTTIAGYIALVDMGMSGSVARILVDYKDRRATGEYGSVIQTGVWVGLVQGVLVFIVGAGLAVVAGPLLKVPGELERKFVWLMVGQSGLMAVNFGTRIFTYLLAAHQRYDIPNYTQAAGCAFNYAVLWICFGNGLGVFSMIWAQACGTVLAVVATGAGCVRLRLLPGSGQWGKPTWRRFNELFDFGRDIFLFVVGGQLVSASQTILLTRVMGLETAAVWSVCTRAYTMLTQMLFRLFDYSCSAFAEMIVRGEKERLFARFKDIVILSGSLSVVTGVLFAVCNGAFVRLWTGGTIGWSAVNDVLLAVWLVVCVNVHAHTGLVGQTKQFRFLRYLYLLEGLFFISLTLSLLSVGGVSAMVSLSIVSSLSFTFPYGLWRTNRYFGLAGTTRAIGWWLRPLKLAAGLVPVAVVAWWLTRRLPLEWQLAMDAVVVGVAGMSLFMRYGVEEPMREELIRRLPRWLSQAFLWVGQKKFRPNGRGCSN